MNNMRNIIVIFLKELKRVFLDKRMLISLFLPGILIYVIYTLMGNLMSTTIMSASTHDTTYEVVYTNNYSSDTSKEPKIVQLFEGVILQTYQEDKNEVHTTPISKEQINEYIAKLENNEIHLLISFTDNFDDKDSVTTSANNITIRYNGESNISSDAYMMASELVQTAYNDYTVNIEDNKYIEPNIGEKDMMMMKIMSFVIPMVTISLLFSTIVSLCPEAIAGEKERGTLASILLTPIRRKDFAIGKILSLSVLAIASGTTSFLGLILSIPKLMGTSISFTIAPVEIILLFLLVISVLLLFIGLGVFISSLANTIKEATSYLSPMMIVFTLFGIIPSIMGANNLFFAFIPVLNVCAAINNLLMGSSNLILFFSLTVVSNIVYTGILIFLITKAFERERIVLGQ